MVYNVNNRIALLRCYDLYMKDSIKINFTIGDKVYCLLHGKGVITTIGRPRPDDKVPVYVRFNNGIYSVQYDIYGHLDLGNGTYSTERLLYVDKSDIGIKVYIEEAVDIPEKDCPVIVWESDGDEQYRRYSAGHIVGGKLMCYESGTTSWFNKDSMRIGWNFWRRV